MTVAGGRRAIAGERLFHFGADLLRPREQDGRVEVALQGDAVTDLRACAAQYSFYLEPPAGLAVEYV